MLSILSLSRKQAGDWAKKFHESEMNPQDVEELMTPGKDLSKVHPNWDTILIRTNFLRKIKSGILGSGVVGSTERGTNVTSEGHAAAHSDVHVQMASPADRRKMATIPSMSFDNNAYVTNDEL